uniref:Uncharacterized protein n=1 Tax=Tanacetum cinerariifolium TaxID=118510 RepID=A0A699ISN5_TANCI|nr:hypothetical protein [Tanacetum cinerariifolium]
MFGNQFICSFKPEANLDKAMVLHQGYLLGGSYHGHDSIFLLNCYGVRWQVEVKQTYANVMSVVGPVWSDFMNKKVLCSGGAYSMLQTDPVEPDTVDLFIKDRECEEFIGKIPSVNHLKTFKFAFYGPDWWSMMDELAIRLGQYFALTLVCRGKFSLTIFNNAGEALTACENYASYVLRNSNCHIEQEPDYNLERMGWYCNWRWHTNHDDEHKAFYIKLTSDVLILGRIRISKGYVDSHGLRVYASAIWVGFILARTQVWRMESYALKVVDDVLLGIFAWGKPVWTGVDDVLQLAPVLKHVVPFLVA